MLHAIEVFSTFVVTFAGGAGSVLFVCWLHDGYTYDVQQEAKRIADKRERDKRLANALERNETFSSL